MIIKGTQHGDQEVNQKSHKVGVSVKRVIEVVISFCLAVSFVHRYSLKLVLKPSSAETGMPT